MNSVEKIAVIYSDDYLKHKIAKHPENPLRLIKTIEVIEKSWLYRSGIITLIQPIKAHEKEVLYVHSKELLIRIKKLAERGGGKIAPDTYVLRNSYDVALLAAGGGLKALEIINEVKRVFVLCRPPGHHAERDLARGFCLINNIAVTAKNALNMGFKRIFILDWDAHHGNGTQKIFYEDPNVFYASIHQDGKTLYPYSGDIEEVGVGDGEGYTVNIPLPPNSSGTVAITCLNEIIIPVIEEFKPDIILISAGYDGHWRDKLADLRYTVDTYYNLMRYIIEVAKKVSNGKIIAMLEGGYDLKYTPQSILRTLEAMSNHIYYEVKEQKMNIIEKRIIEILIKKAKKVLSKYWNV